MHTFLDQFKKKENATDFTLHLLPAHSKYFIYKVLRTNFIIFFDFMLSVEECENMSRYDRQDRNGRQHQEGFWKRAPQQRWNTQDHYHLGHTDHYIHGKNDLNR